MKQATFTFLLFSAIGLISCRKNRVDPNITQYDQQQIQAYITANGLTGMKRDTVGGDTSGIYYNIISPGSGPAVQYPDSVAIVYTVRSLDGQYSSLDTIYNHAEDLLGHLAAVSGTPYGVQLAIHDVLKYKGASMRVIIPSRLAYGLNGYGSVNTTVANGKIAGNQSLDYYIHMIDDRVQVIGGQVVDNGALYDDMIIKNYLTSNNLTGYQKTPSGLYYKVLTPGLGTDPITYNSTVTVSYISYLLDGVIFDQYDPTDGTGTPLDIPDQIPGLQEGLENYATAGSYVSFIMPSKLAYGKASSGSTPPNSCVRYDVLVLDVSP
jgi:FKBP-type peptidyl-prolyl cis-trans isomerase FkpA